MTTPKCPLCGEELKELRCATVKILCNVYCPKCRWFTQTGDGIKAWDEAKRIISLYPPIMRLNQGDNVLIWLSDDIHTVLYTNINRGKIYLQDVYGDAQSYDVDEIEKWPWELEQKGGQQ